MAGFFQKMMANQMAKMMPGMGKVQEALAKITATGTAEGGLVKVVIGKASDLSSEVTSIKIDDALIKTGSAQRIEQAVKTAVNDAMKKEFEQLKTTMMDVAKHMQPPA